MPRASVDLNLFEKLTDRAQVRSSDHSDHT
jgi:hypothetical protein